MFNWKGILQLFEFLRLLSTLNIWHDIVYNVWRLLKTLVDCFYQFHQSCFLLMIPFSSTVGGLLPWMADRRLWNWQLWRSTETTSDIQVLGYVMNDCIFNVKFVWFVGSCLSFVEGIMGIGKKPNGKQRFRTSWSTHKTNWKGPASFLRNQGCLWVWYGWGTCKVVEVRDVKSPVFHVCQGIKISN